MARRRRHFSGTAAQHRAMAGTDVKTARKAAQDARRYAQSGDCERAVHYFGVAAYYAGSARGNRNWLRGSKRVTHLGGRIASLQRTIARACVR